MNSIKSTGAIAPSADRSFTSIPYPTDFLIPKFHFGQRVHYVDKFGDFELKGEGIIRAIDYVPENIPDYIESEWAQYGGGYFSYSILPLPNESLPPFFLTNIFETIFVEEDLEAIE